MKIIAALFSLAAFASVCMSAKAGPWKAHFKTRTLTEAAIKTYKASLGFRPELAKLQNARLNTISYDQTVKACTGPIPDTWNWKEKPGVVTPIRNQGSCGSCYAFSAMATIEASFGVWNFTKGLDLSEQQIVDCSTANYGCQGGLMTLVYNYLVQQKVGGAVLDQRYPYQGRRLRCAENTIKSSKKYAPQIRHVAVPVNIDDIKRTIYCYGPVSVGIHAGSDSFFAYTGGVYNNATQCGAQPDHGVVLTGYGQENNEFYWIVKNSWGVSWGQEGYMKMQGRSDCQNLFMISAVLPKSVADAVANNKPVKHNWT